jgi:hypothetical protein
MIVEKAEVFCMSTVGTKDPVRDILVVSLNKFDRLILASVKLKRLVGTNRFEVAKD